MKDSDIKVGMSIVLNTLDDAQVYTVESFSYNGVYVNYKRADGQMTRPVRVISYALIEPTAKQLENSVSNPNPDDWERKSVSATP